MEVTAKLASKPDACGSIVERRRRRGEEGGEEEGKGEEEFKNNRQWWLSILNEELFRKTRQMK